MARNLERKRPPRWTAPVPEMVWRVAACTESQYTEREDVGDYLLGGTYSSFFDGGAVWTEDEFLSSRGEFCETSYGQVFVIEVRVIP